jgi:hypothetical protein
MPQRDRNFDPAEIEYYNILHIAPGGAAVMLDRRDDHRIPLQIFLNEYVRERHHRAVTTNVSPSGLFIHRTFAAGVKRLPIGRHDRFVQLEFALPGTSDTIWARGEIRYDELGVGNFVHGTGIYLTDLARGHARLLKEYVLDEKRRRLQGILDLIRRNRYH